MKQNRTKKIPSLVSFLMRLASEGCDGVLLFFYAAASETKAHHNEEAGIASLKVGQVD